MLEADPRPRLSVQPMSPSEANVFCPSPAICLGGPSVAMTHLRNQIRRVAPYFRTALLTGELGCGAEAAARTLHQLSPRARDPFLALNATEAELRFGPNSLPANLATEGMLYLPRPERLPKAGQMALLRLLREHGSNAPRIVAFAERGLRPLVTAAGFSADLAESLNALRIALPSLRERREDISELLTLIVQEFAALSGNTPPQLAPDLLDAATNLPWPGNFNQLSSAATALSELAAKGILGAEDLVRVLGAIPTPAPVDRRELRTVRLDDVIQEHIRTVLFACSGNKLRTAEALGISRSTLYRMLEAHAPSRVSPPLEKNGQNLKIAS
jgi:DNA-binding NtrC family response regulator